MSQVDFNDEHKASVLYSRFQPSQEMPTLVRWIMKIGIANTPRGANAVLLGVAVLAFILTGVVIYKMNSGVKAPKFTPQQIQMMSQMGRPK